MPDFFIIAGPNGAGKTTLTTSLKDQKPEINLINGDTVYQDLKNAGTPADAAHLEAKRITTELFFGYLRDRKSFVVESNMDKSFSYDMFDKAEKAGFRTHLYYIGVEDPEICFARVQARYNTKTGHFVAYDEVVERYRNSLFQLRTNFRKADSLIFFDNTDFKLDPVLYAEKGQILELKVKCLEWIQENFKTALTLQEKLKLQIKNVSKLNRGLDL